MKEQIFKNLTGMILIASPYTMSGNIFHKSIIYVLSHTENGSIGLIVNHKINNLPFKTLLKNITDPNITDDMTIPVYLGGPIEPERGFFLHTKNSESSGTESNPLTISSSAEVISEIAHGNLPKQSLFVVGYTGWTPGQLESEIESNLWIVDEYKESIVFSEMNENKWSTALQQLGINDAYFASNIGHG